MRQKRVETKAMNYQIRHVLAGAYPSSDGRSFLVHAAIDDKPVCNRVKSESLADSGATRPDDIVTCKVCLTKLGKLDTTENDV